MNILVTVDKNYIPQLRIMLTSLLRSNPQESFTVYVAHSKIEDCDFEKIRQCVDARRCNIVPIMVEDSLFEQAPTLSRISKETYYRLLAFAFLPKSVERVLYLDADTVVINPIRPYYDIEFGQNLIAASSHVLWFLQMFNRFRLCMPKGTKYINAGVILMNIKGLRECGITPECIFEYIQINSKRLWLADQDVLNGLYSKRTLLLDARRFNMDEKVFKNSGSKITLDWVEQNTAVVHFNGSEKPWKQSYMGQLGFFYDRYDEDYVTQCEKADQKNAKICEKSQKNIKKKRAIVGILLILLLVLGIFTYLFSARHILEFFENPPRIQAWLESLGLWSVVIFIAVRTLQTVFKFIPAEPLEIGAGYAFGAWEGLLYCMIGTMLGSLIILLLMRLFGIKLLSLFVPTKKLRSFNFLRNKKRLTLTLFIVYLIPGTPKDLITYIVGFIPIRTTRFLAITGIARIPSILMSTFSGMALSQGNILLAVAIPVVLFSITGVYLLITKKRQVKQVS